MDISRKLAVQAELFLVGEHQEEVVASVMGGYDGHRGSVFYLAVSPSCQGQGYGKLLMAKLEELLIAMGCPKLNIVVRTSNNVAPNRTLQRVGFRYVKTHNTVPGPLNFHQAVTRWLMEERQQIRN